LNSTVSHTAKEEQASHDESREKKIVFWDTVNIVLKTTGVVAWFVILLFTVLEIKRYFNLDLIPGYNSAIDDVYNAVRNVISQ